MAAVQPLPLSRFRVWADDASATVSPAGAPETAVNEDFNRCIVVCDADIASLQVDAIVNPTDTTMAHTSPIASRIAAVAGPGLAQECAAAGKLTLGQALLTKGYGLPARSVLHTALPRYNAAYKAACAAALAEALNSCLRIVASTSPPFKSIALPVLHSEEQGWPADWATRLMLRTLRTWMEAQPASPPLPTLVLVAECARSAPDAP